MSYHYSAPLQLETWSTLYPYYAYVRF